MGIQRQAIDGAHLEEFAAEWELWPKQSLFCVRDCLKRIKYVGLCDLQNTSEE